MSSKRQSTRVSIIVPVYNEYYHIVDVIERILKAPMLECVEKEVIIVDDGSTDGTREILLEMAQDMERLKVLLHDANQGKGAAIRTAIGAATGDVCIIQDADLEYDPADYKKFEKLFLDFNADGVIGSRFIYSDYTRSHNILNKIGNKILTLMFNLLYNVTFTDIYSCYFAFKKDLLNANELKTDGFEQHAEILCKVMRRGNKFYEVPIRFNARSHSEGKKIKAQDFFSVLFQIIRGRI